MRHDAAEPGIAHSASGAMTPYTHANVKSAVGTQVASEQVQHAETKEDGYSAIQAMLATLGAHTTFMTSKGSTSVLILGSPCTGLRKGSGRKRSGVIAWLPGGPKYACSSLSRYV